MAEKETRIINNLKVALDNHEIILAERVAKNKELQFQIEKIKPDPIGIEKLDHEDFAEVLSLLNRELTKLQKGNVKYFHPEKVHIRRMYDDTWEQEVLEAKENQELANNFIDLEEALF